MSLERYDEHLPVLDQLQWDDGDSALAQKNGTAATSLGQRIDAILAVNTGVAAETFYLGIRSDVPVSQVLGSFSIPAGQGWTGTPALDVLAAVLPAGVQYLTLKAGYSIYLANESALGTGEYVNVLIMGGQL